mgnify:CR=1 FL=1
MREVWFYSMFDADGNLLHEGTAAELVEKGLFKNTQTVTNVFLCRALQAAGHLRPDTEEDTAGRAVQCAGSQKQRAEKEQATDHGN